MKGYYDCSYDKLMQGVDPNDYDDNPYDDDPDVWLTDELQCSDCGFQFDIETIEHFFDVDESGIQPGTVHGPAVHWARGFVICPGCNAGLPYETSS